MIVAAFEDAEEFDSFRTHNRPLSALWIDDASYLQDVKSPLGELRT